MRVGRKFAAAVVVLISLALVHSTASAVSCSAIGGIGPQTYYTTTAPTYYYYFSFTDTSAQPVVATGFMGDGCLGCSVGTTTVDFGCTVRGAMGTFASFWYLSSMSSANNTMNVCSFMTAMGSTCQIRGGDGLPIELMEFSVDD